MEISPLENTVGGDSMTVVFNSSSLINILKKHIPHRVADSDDQERGRHSVQEVSG